MNRKKPEDLIPKPVSLWVDPNDAEEFKQLATETGRTQRGLFAIILKEGKRSLLESVNLPSSSIASARTKRKR